MRAAKNFLVDEVEQHLRKSDYVYLANFDRITVEDVGRFRDKLSAEKAEFHVVKNSVLRVAAKRLNYPDLESYLTGPTAIIVGGKNASGVAKVMRTFFEGGKGELKMGVVSQKAFNADQVKALSELPSLDVLRAQLLGLLSKPAQSFVFVLNGVPTALLNALQAKAKKAA